MHRSVLNVQYNDCSNVIQRLFAERSQLAKELIHTHRFLFDSSIRPRQRTHSPSLPCSSSLSLLNDMVLNHTRKSLSMSPKFDLIQLASYLQTLAASLFSSLKARLPQQQTASNPRQLSIQLELTEIEACALEVSETSIRDDTKCHTTDGIRSRSCRATLRSRRCRRRAIRSRRTSASWSN